MGDPGFGAPPPPPPPSAGGGGQIPPRAVGEVFSVAFDIYRANASKLVMIVAIVVVPLTLLSALLTEVAFAVETRRVSNPLTGVVDEVEVARSFGTVILVAVIAALIAVIISAVLQASLMRGAALASVGDPLDIEASYRYGFRRFGSVIFLSILVGLTVAIGFVLLVIPGLIFLVMLSVAIPALVVEDARGTKAMGRSWELVKGYFWHVVGVIVVGFLINFVVGLILGVIGSAFGDNWFFTFVFDSAGQIIVAPFVALVTVVLYLDLRARKEALTGDQLRMELASNA